MLAQALHQPHTLLDVDRWAFIIVITDAAVKADAGLAQRQQPAFHRRHRHARPRVRVGDAVHIRPCLVDGAVNDVARHVDPVIGVRLPDDVPLHIDLGEAGGGDFLVGQPIEVDQQMLGAGDADGDVVVDQIRHVVHVHQPVAGGEIHPRLPFLGADLILDARKIGGVVHRRCSRLLFWLDIGRPDSVCPAFQPDISAFTQSLEWWEAEAEFVRSLPISTNPTRSDDRREVPQLSG